MELLVHISASTSRKEDDRYLAQAAAYLKYKPSTSLHLSRESGERASANQTPAPSEQLQPTYPGGTRSQIGHVTDMSNRGTTAPELSQMLSIHQDGHQRPRSSPMERLEQIQEIWQRSSRSLNRKRPINYDQTDSNIIFDTQFAFSALESQLISQLENKNFPISGLHISDESRLPPPKRIRLSSDEENDSQHYTAETASLELAVPNAMPQQDHNLSDHENGHGRHSARPRTPQPDSLNSLLPSDYGLSATSTDTSQVTTQQSQPIPVEVLAPGSPLQPRLSPATQIYRGSSSQIQAECDDEAERVSHARTEVPGAPQTSDIQVLASPQRPLFPVGGDVPDTSFAPIAITGLVPECTNDIMAAKANYSPSKPYNDKKHIIGSRPRSQRFQEEAVNKPIRPLTAGDRTTVPVSSAMSLSTLPFEVHAPDPPVSNKSFAESSYITMALANLANIQNLVKRYKPIEHGPIGKHTRGSWEFDTTSWPLDKQIAFWESLCKTIGEGSLGWSVRCGRNVDTDKGIQRPLDPSGNEWTTLGTVRVFCAGEVIMHMYLVLWTLSGREIRRTGARWRTATEVKVEVPRFP
ncbi:hypothetical protein NA57DRAFT_78218 [Rhizodiscina lignyota]|uniref:Uncharacterized protein n=1 Tax=Rhizodiscina lignyota TaxID=1504668 RepID=A0A9P4IE88_9PEZI|nr:hypothetical protein NA57DRAFT_78218 [Rhizodiscina lignyota]